MSSNQETWRAGVLGVAELAVTRFQSTGRCDALAGRLRRAIDEANREPKSLDKLDLVWEIMRSEPELEELLREKFPEGARPRPFDNMDAG
jgi:hypothetical protein